jgi:hypothetical protein
LIFGAVSRRFAGFLPFSIRAAICVLEIFIGRRTQNLNFAGRLSSVIFNYQPDRRAANPGGGFPTTL